MTSATLQQYSEEVTKDNLALLGQIAWYTVRDVRVNHQQVLQLLHDNGMGSTLVPPYPSDVNTFKRVTTAAKRLRNPVPDRTEIYENYLVRDVDSRGKDAVLRHIVCEQVNATGKKLGYTEVMSVEYIRSNGLIRTAMLPQCIDINQKNIAMQMANDIKREYQAWKGRLGSYAIREFVRHVVLSVGGTCVKESGGVYFVPQEHAEKVKALQEFVRGIPGGSSMTLIPLPDDHEQRDMIKRAFQSESIGEIDAAMAEIMALKEEARNRGKDITQAQADAFMQRHAVLRENTKKYEELLEDGLHEIKMRIPLFQRQVLELRAAASAAKAKK